MDEYIAEILKDIGDKGPITRDEFFRLCQKDINAGYAAEVDAAWDAYRKLYVPDSASPKASS